MEDCHVQLVTLAFNVLNTKGKCQERFTIDRNKLGSGVKLGQQRVSTFPPPCFGTDRWIHAQLRWKCAPLIIRDSWFNSVRFEFCHRISDILPAFSVRRCIKPNLFPCIKDRWLWPAISRVVLMARLLNSFHVLWSSESSSWLRCWYRETDLGS